METPIQALDNLCIPYTHSFSCDNSTSCRKTIECNYTPKIFYEDITKRDNIAVASVDLYVAGFPCQPLSVAGKQQGFDDAHGRGTIFFQIRDYLKAQKPKFFILENVAGLVTLDNGKYLEVILKALKDLQVYTIHHQLLNTKEHGIPQNRSRWYCVGILTSVLKGPFQFPKRIQCASIEDVLEPSGQRPCTTVSPKATSETASKNILRAESQIEAKGGDHKSNHS